MWPGCIYLQPERWESARSRSEVRLSSAMMTHPTRATRISTCFSFPRLTFEESACPHWCSGSWPFLMTCSAGYCAPFITTHRCWTVTPWLWRVLPSQWAQTKPYVISSTAPCMTGISVELAHRNGLTHSLRITSKTPNDTSSTAIHIRSCYVDLQDTKVYNKRHILRLVCI